MCKFNSNGLSELCLFCFCATYYTLSLANTLQVCLDSGAKKVLLPITSAADMGTVPPELMGSFQIIFYNSAEDAVFKALGVE